MCQVLRRGKRVECSDVYGTDLLISQQRKIAGRKGVGIGRKQGTCSALGVHIKVRDFLLCSDRTRIDRYFRIIFKAVLHLSTKVCLGLKTIDASIREQAS